MCIIWYWEPSVIVSVCGWSLCVERRWAEMLKHLAVSRWLKHQSLQGWRSVSRKRLLTSNMERSCDSRPPRQEWSLKNFNEFQSPTFWVSTLSVWGPWTFSLDVTWHGIHFPGGGTQLWLITRQATSSMDLPPFFAKASIKEQIIFLIKCLLVRAEQMNWHPSSCGSHDSPTVLPRYRFGRVAGTMLCPMHQARGENRPATESMDAMDQVISQLNPLVKKNWIPGCAMYACLVRRSIFSPGRSCG